MNKYKTVSLTTFIYTSSGITLTNEDWIQLITALIMILGIVQEFLIYWDKKAQEINNNDKK